MTDQSLKALIYPFQQNQLPWPDAGQRALFLNAVYAPALARFTALDWRQDRKEDAACLEKGIGACEDGEVRKEYYDTVLVLLPKQEAAARYMLACGLRALKTKGALVAAAANDAGGRRIETYFKTLGLTPAGESKYKCRVVWAEKPAGISKTCIKCAQDWIKGGAMQPVLEGAYMSQPGLFGWDKVDPGSLLLATCLKEKNGGALSGTGADFGCGWGYLACALVRDNPDISALLCIDSDRRALACCEINLQKAKRAARISCLWRDLQDDLSSEESGLDWVVSNPPFHKGKDVSAALGLSFIKTAHSALRRDGVLWMVANAHLPYENELTKRFARVDKIFEGQGYKIYAATK